MHGLFSVTHALKSVQSWLSSHHRTLDEVSAGSLSSSRILGNSAISEASEIVEHPNCLRFWLSRYINTVSCQGVR